MGATPLPDLSALASGLRKLWRHPWWSLALGILSALLAALGAGLQIRFHIPSEPVKDLLVTSAAMLPLELYFVPRLLLALDAEELDHPGNPRHAWRRNFEERWLRAFGAKILLSVLVALGAALLVVPGLLVLLAFGWAPLRVLLRGERLQDAARGSLRLMAHLWPRAVFVVCGLLTVYLAGALACNAFQLWIVPVPTPWLRLAHPACWTASFVAGLLNLWLAAALLALYQGLEAAAERDDAGRPGLG